MSFLEKIFDFLASVCDQYVVDNLRQSTDIDSRLNDIREALPKAYDLIRRSECWRLPKYDPIDKLLPQLKDAVYEAESIVDLLEYQRLKCDIERSLPGDFLAHYFQNWISGFPEKVVAVQKNLQMFHNKMEEACIQLHIPENHNQFSETARPTTTRSSNTSNVYGRDKELNYAIRLLGVPISTSKGTRRTKREKDNVGILSIVGLGGVGKTTLAQMVCNNSSVKSYFDKQIWICISENFDVKRLTKEILECTGTRKRYDDNNLDKLQLILQNILESKRFLLVLDDAWSDNEKEWESLLGPMRRGIKGSVILVTTRSKKVAEVVSKDMSSMDPIYLEGLEENIYWEFFKSCAYGLEVENCHPELERVGKQICEKLRGSPLAAKTIGGLLKINFNVGHWSSIRDSRLWQLKQEEHHILPVLQLSYQYLPSYLKKCFSFCALYPKDYKFTKEELFKLWIIHGFINSRENPQQVPDVLAEIYFDELVRRCFFQKAAGSRSDKYVIHDLMHDVCQSITKDECFCLEEEDFNEKISVDIRHLSIFKTKLSREKQNELGKYKKLLSLSVAYPSSAHTKTIETWCNKLTSIRSLSLVKCRIKLPNSIGNLKYLRYLDMSFSTVHELPESFCTLYNLQYLNMEGSSCQFPTNFPQGSEKLVSLQDFYFPSQGMTLEGLASNFARKIVVKDLKLFLTKERTIIDKIQNLKNISIQGSLTINSLEVVPNKEAAEEAQLNRKPSINSLYLSWSLTRGHTGNRSLSNRHHDEDILQGLCPHPNLQFLNIKNYKGRNVSPSWLKEEFLPNLTEIQFERFQNDFTISHLPRFITKLGLWYCFRIKDLRNCLRPDHLPALKKLDLSDCKRLVSLPVELFGGFVYLENLVIFCCPKLHCPDAMVLPPSLKTLSLMQCGELERSLPGCLRNLTSLEVLEISDCTSLVSIPAEVAASLISLTSLSVWDCAELQSLGGQQFLTSLHELKIERCEKLKETGGRDVEDRLTPEMVEDLPSSSHGGEAAQEGPENELKLQVHKKGKFSNDILSASLGTPEHSGRLRGHPDQEYVVEALNGKGKRKATSHAACEEKINKLQAQVHELMSTIMVQKEIGKNDSPATGAIPPPTKDSSNHFLGQPMFDLQPPQAKVPNARSRVGKLSLFPDELMEGLPKPYHDLYKLMMGQLETSWEIRTDEQLFHHVDCEMVINLSLEDIVEVYKNEWLGTQIMQIWCMYCKDKLDVLISDKFLFADPEALCKKSIEVHPEGATQYLNKIAEKIKPDQYIFVPYCTGVHWILLVVSFEKRIVHYVDSLNTPMNRSDLDLRHHLDTAARHYWKLKGNSRYAAQLRILDLRQIMSPTQGTGECGYYVMRNMLDIILNHSDPTTNLPEPLIISSVTALPSDELHIQRVKISLIQYLIRDIF